MRKKRFLAVLLVASMTMANVVTAIAAPTEAEGSKPIATGSNPSGTVIGNGQLEGVVDTDIFNVVVPTTISEGSIFDYILDPQELIKETDAKRYIGNTVSLDQANDNVPVSINSSANFTPSTLYFVNGLSANGKAVSSGGLGLSDTSDPFTLINKSTMDVDVSVNATLAGGRGITVSTDESLPGNETSMYMAIKSGNVKKTISGSVATGSYLLTGTMADANDLYEKVVSDNNVDYKYEIVSQNDNGDPISDNDFGQYSFQLTGKSNTNGDWSQYAKAGATAPTAPTVTVTYYLTPHVAKPASIATSSYTIVENQNILIDVDFGDMGATRIDKITYIADSMPRDLATNNYSFANGVLTINAQYLNAVRTALGSGGSREYTINFDKGDPVIFTLHV